jgi:hypothetical protein
MLLTPRLAEIIAAMIDAKLDAEDLARVAPSVRMTRAPSRPSCSGPGRAPAQESTREVE